MYNFFSFIPRKRSLQSFSQKKPKMCKEKLSLKANYRKVENQAFCINLQ